MSSVPPPASSLPASPVFSAISKPVRAPAELLPPSTRLLGMHEAVHHFQGARSTPGPRRGWTDRLVEMPFCRVFNRDQKKKSAWTFQDTKHCLCWFQSWVTSRGPSVRETIVEQQQRVKIGAGQERKPNQSRPMSHQRNPGHLTKATPTPSHQSTGCHPQVCKPLFLLPMSLHERISGCSTNSNDQYSSRCWSRNGSPIFLFTLMLCQW